VKPFYETQPLHFSCTRCGGCCETPGDYFVFTSVDEAERIRAYRGLSTGWFRRRYLRRLGDGQLVLAAGSHQRCIFLDAERRCSVYPVRPLQCRTYPYWPEIVASGRAWRREGRRCEGIGRGEAVPVGKIRHAVSACQAK